MANLQPLGHLNVGSPVQAPREADDTEFEPCTIKSIDAAAATADLAFGDGFVRKNVPIGSLQLVKSADGSFATYVAAPTVGDQNAANAASTANDDKKYAEEVGSQLPAPPTKEALAADPEVKYAYVKAYKDAGNALFKAGKYAWAIRTYCDAVDALVRHCYESRERMLWDYFARGPCGQCYSNSALCALKQGEHEHAAKLCDLALSCKPEDTDLVKVLLRHGQALLGIPGGESRAKEQLELAAQKEPQNRAVREELQKAKKACLVLHKAADRRLFEKVDLQKQGLTSKKELALETLKENLEKGFEALVEHQDRPALDLLAPLLEGKAAEAPHRLGSTMLASYGCGIAFYHLKQLEKAVECLGLFFTLQKKLDADVVDAHQPLMGIPLARFYFGHALFELKRLEQAREALLAYAEDVELAGPQRLLNMPASMMGGKVVSDAERAASRFKAKASSFEARADSCTMLAIIAERIDGPAGAVQWFARCIELSNNDIQKAEAHDNLARTYGALNEHDKQKEHLALEMALREKIAKAEEAEKRKKAEEAEKEKKQLAESDEMQENGVENGGEAEGTKSLGEAYAEMKAEKVAAEAAPPLDDFPNLPVEEGGQGRREGTGHRLDLSANEDGKGEAALHEAMMKEESFVEAD